MNPTDWEEYVSRRTALGFTLLQGPRPGVRLNHSPTSAGALSCCSHKSHGLFSCKSIFLIRLPRTGDRGLGAPGLGDQE